MTRHTRRARAASLLITFIITVVSPAPHVRAGDLVARPKSKASRRVPRPARAVGKRPLNFVLIYADDLGWADTGAYGSTFHRTPNIDRLAARGMKFTDAYAAAPVCSPSRAALLTGKHPARLHLTDWLPGREDSPNQKLLRPAIRSELPLSEQTIAEALQARGYSTASIGKWHLGGEGYGPREQGFDLNIAGDHHGVPVSYFYPYRRGAEFMPRLEDGREGEYLTDRLSAEAESFIERNRERPFFLYLSHYAVHIPMKAKPSVVERYRAAARQGGKQNNAIYAAMLESLDESVGRVLRKLDELKLLDNTVVIFTSDNGGLTVEEGPNTPPTSNAPLRDGKGYLYEGGIRVPLIIYWPEKVRPGRLCATPVSGLDLFPTIAEMAGLKGLKGSDGASLLPLFGRERCGLRRNSLYWHYPHYSNQGGLPGGAIREGDLKLIEFYEDNRLELYDLRRDPGETHNLAGQMRARARALREKLARWRVAVGAQSMTRNPNYKNSSGINLEKR